MTWNSMRPTLRGRLARHLGRLQQSLDEVAEQVREAIATTVGRRMAEAVGEAVYEALCPGSGSAPPLPRSSSAGYDSASRRDWNEPAWQRDTGHSDRRDAYDYDDVDPRYDDDPELTASRHNEPRSGVGAVQWRRVCKQQLGGCGGIPAGFRYWPPWRSARLLAWLSSPVIPAAWPAWSCPRWDWLTCSTSCVRPALCSGATFDPESPNVPCSSLLEPASVGCGLFLSTLKLETSPMTATARTNLNGQPRKTLASQIDRLDGILDGLDAALAGAVQEAVEQAVKQAVQTVLTEALTNSELQEQLQEAAQPSPPPEPPRGKKSTTNRLWQATTEAARQTVKKVKQFGRGVGMVLLAAGGVIVGVVYAARRQIVSAARTVYRHGKRLVRGAVSALTSLLPSFAFGG